MLRFLILLSLVTLTGVFADDLSYQEPDAQDLRQASKISADIIDRVDRLLANPDFLDELRSQSDRVGSMSSQANSGSYNLDALSPETPEELILSRVLAAGQSVGEGLSVEWTNSPFVLVSLSMPDSAIRSLMIESSRVGSSIVLRGAIDNDIPSTIARIQKIVGDTEIGGLIIDPTLFQRFDAESVPTFILPLEPIKTCNENGCPVGAYVKAHGSSSLLNFLETAARLGSPSEQGVADKWLELYQGNRYAQ